MTPRAGLRSEAVALESSDDPPTPLDGVTTPVVTITTSTRVVVLTITNQDDDTAGESSTATPDEEQSLTQSQQGAGLITSQRGGPILIYRLRESPEGALRVHRKVPLSRLQSLPHLRH